MWCLPVWSVSLFRVHSGRCWDGCVIYFACLASMFFFFKQKTAYEMRISDWSSDVCSSDLGFIVARNGRASGAKAMRLRANLGHDARGWLADLKELRFDNELLARGSLRWLQDARGREIDVNADELHLSRLMPWLAVWRDAPPALSQAARLSGAVRNLVLRRA